MCLLNRDEILRYVRSPDQILGELEIPDHLDGPKSQFQISSVNLRVGNIYIPPKEPLPEGQKPKQHKKFTIEPGETAVITTLEHLTLPDHLAGIVFPIARQSTLGLMMTNPGHIDPKTNGPLHSTIINMGRNDLILVREEPVMTLLLFEIKKTTPIDGDAPSDLDSVDEQYDPRIMVNSLQPDFLNVTNRANAIADEFWNKKETELKRREITTAFWVAIVPVVAAIIAAFVTVIRPAWKDEIAAVRESIATIQGELDLTATNQRIDSLIVELNTRPRN